MTDSTTPAAPAVKLSELIRTGAAMVDGRQWQLDFIGYDENGQVCLCATGAAYYAKTGYLPESISPWKHGGSPFGALWETHRQAGLMEQIVFMNDSQHMTFEEIAQALEAKGL